MRAVLIAAALLALAATPAMAAGGGIARIERLSGPDPGTVAARDVRALADSAFVDTGERRRLAGEQINGWWRITAPGGKDLLFLVYDPYGARVTVLAPPDYETRTQRVFDDGLDPRYSRHALVFPLSGADGPLYVRVSEARGYPLQVAVREAAGHAADDFDHVRIMTAIEGVLAAVALVALLFWAMLRERVYLLYAVSMSLQLLYLLCAGGEAYALPGLRRLAAFGVTGIWFVATASTTASLYFLLDFADLRRRAPRMSRLLNAMGIVLLLLLALLLSPWPADKGWFPNVGNLTLLIANGLALATLLLAWRRGGRHAGYVLIAWIPVALLSTARAVQLSSDAALSPWLEYGLPVAMGFSAIVLVLGLADRMLTFRRERDQAKHHAERDPLTGTYNRAGIEQRLELALTQARRDDETLSLLFLDLDHFKQINDRHGHPLGDDCLRTLVQTVTRELRHGDALGRIGGEEFLLILPRSDGVHAQAVAERIRRSVQQYCHRIGEAPVALTVSIGVAEYRGGSDSPAALIARADEALYLAKRAGRNRVVLQDAAA